MRRALLFVLIALAACGEPAWALMPSYASTNSPANSGKLYCYNHTPLSIYAATGWVAAPTAETTLFTCTVGANDMGPNGRLIVTTMWSHTSSANTKTLRVRWGGASGSLITNGAPTTTLFTKAQSSVINRAATNSQLYGANYVTSFGSSGTAGAISTATIDTTADTTIVVAGTTGLESGQQTTALVGLDGTCTATKASNGLAAGDYIKVSSGGNCPTSGTPNAANTPVLTINGNDFTYACDCVGTEAGTQPTFERYSRIALESVDVELVKP